MPTGWVKRNPTRDLPADWPKRRERTLLRDGHRCQHVREDTQRKCLQWGNEVDHIVERSDGGSDDDSNLVTLCAWHHQQKTSRHAGLKSQRQRRAWQRRRMPAHPGLMP